MNRKKLQRRTALAAKIAERYNPPYRVVTPWGNWGAAATREDARRLKKAGRDYRILQLHRDATGNACYHEIR